MYAIVVLVSDPSIYPESHYRISCSVNGSEQHFLGVFSLINCFKLFTFVYAAILWLDCIISSNELIVICAYLLALCVLKVLFCFLSSETMDLSLLSLISVFATKLWQLKLQFRIFPFFHFKSAVFINSLVKHSTRV